MKVSNTKDELMHHLFALIVGPSGVGKSSLAKTLPEDETLIISAESGLLPLRGANIEVWTPENVQDVISIFLDLQKGKKLSNGKTPKHVIIDSLTEIGELFFSEMKPKYSKAQTFNLYEEYSTKIISLIKSLRDMNAYNFFMLALDKDMGENTIGIDLIQKSLSKKIPCYFDLVMHYKTFEGESGTVRKLITDNTISDFCKDRSGALDQGEEPSLQNILTKIFKGE